MERAPRMGGKRPRKKVCMFCVDRVDVIDYKDTYPQACSHHCG